MLELVEMSWEVTWEEWEMGHSPGKCLSLFPAPPPG